MNLEGAKLLVIGGAGFIGSHVVDQLLKEDVASVVIYDDFSRGRMENLEDALRDPRVSIFEHGGNILHRDVLDAAMQGVDCVIHLAALWLLHCQDYPDSAFEVNVRGTMNVLQACVANNVRRLVYSSSASVYGDAVEIPMTEEHPFNNQTFYGATKVAGEQMCRAFHHRYGLDYVALRYMNVYGPRQDERGVYTSVIMKVMDRVRRGERPVIFGDGSQSYDFVYVTDVARANVIAAGSDVTNEEFNVGTGVRTSIRELIEGLLAQMESPLEPEYRPQEASFVQQRVGSTRKASEMLGFDADISLERGLRELVDWTGVGVRT